MKGQAEGVERIKLSDGYWFIHPDVVEKYGEDFIDKLNQMTPPKEGK